MSKNTHEQLNFHTIMNISQLCWSDISVDSSDKLWGYLFISSRLNPMVILVINFLVSTSFPFFNSWQRDARRVRIYIYLTISWFPSNNVWEGSESVYLFYTARLTVRRRGRLLFLHYKSNTALMPLIPIPQFH